MLLLWLKTIGLVIFAMVSAVVLSTLLAMLFNSPGDVLFFSRSLIAASLGYIVLAFSPSWRAQFNRFAGIYTAVWPLVGSICVSAAHLLTLPRVSDLSETSPGTALLGGILMAVHPFLSVYLTSLLNSKTKLSGSLDERAISTPTSLGTAEPNEAELAKARKFDLLRKHSREVSSAYKELSRAPVRYQVSFKDKIVASSNPSSEAGRIAYDLLADLQREKMPFTDKKANDWHWYLWEYHGEKAAAEYREALEALGPSADKRYVFDQIKRAHEAAAPFGIGDVLRWGALITIISWLFYMDTR